MARLEISNNDLRIKYFGVKPRWWVRAMSTVADTLWNWHLTTASWTIADLCLWLQKKTRPNVPGGKAV